MPFSPCDASCSSSSVPNEPSACCDSARPPPPLSSTSLTAAKTYRKRKRQSIPGERIIVTKKRRTCSLDSSTADKPVNDMQVAAASPPRNINVSVELVLFDKSWITADSLPTSQEEPDDDQSKDQTSDTKSKKRSINLAKFGRYSSEDLEEERKYGVSTRLSLSLV